MTRRVVLAALLAAAGCGSQLSVTCTCADRALSGIAIDQHAGWNGAPEVEGSFEDAVRICRAGCADRD